MPTYTIHPEKPYRSFSIYKDDKLLASVKFPSIWSSKSEVLIEDKTYRFLPAGWWWKDTQLIQGEKIVATLKTNSFKNAVVLKGEGPKGWFAIKRRGFLKRGYNLINAKEKAVAEIIPELSIKPRYSLVISDDFIESFESHIGLLMLVHHCRMMERSAAASS